VFIPEINTEITHFQILQEVSSAGTCSEMTRCPGEAFPQRHSSGFRQGAPNEFRWIRAPGARAAKWLHSAPGACRIGCCSAGAHIPHCVDTRNSEEDLDVQAVPPAKCCK